MSTDDPTYEQVKFALRRALYARDPIDRADATTQVAWWGLPASPDALSLAAERAYTDPAVTTSRPARQLA
jgi:hypothetical protein